jgi:hypothetical protein
MADPGTLLESLKTLISDLNKILQNQLIKRIELLGHSTIKTDFVQRNFSGIPFNFSLPLLAPQRNG